MKLFLSVFLVIQAIPALSSDMSQTDAVSASSAAATYVNKAGDTMTGGLFTTTITVNASTLVTSGGKVGIGTASPATKLHMSSGTLTLDGAGSSISIQGQDTSLNLKSLNGGTGQTINLGAANQNETNQFNFLSSDSQINWQIRLPFSVNGQLGFIPSTAGGGTTFTTAAMVISSAGNVGIGTASPATKLDVNGDAQFGSGATKSTFTATGFWEPYSRTKAQIDLLVPTKVGQVIDCTDCTLPGLCRSTGTLAAQWRKMESATLGCGTNN